jgi:2,3-bisphosphoglycerate-dependent phosphoglycerate mutase
VPLNPTGLAQAHAVAERLRWRGITTIVASPLSRAKVTADIVAAALGLPVQVDEALREVRFGVQEGQPMTDWFHDWIEGRFTPEGAEPFSDLRARAVGAINRALELPMPVLVVAHGALFRSLRSAMGLPAHERLPNAMPMWCAPPPPDWSLTAL